MIENSIRHHSRLYQVPAEKKTVEDCANHGLDHRAYGWYGGVDPRWSEEQLVAYERAYHYGESPPKVDQGESL